MKIKYSTLLMGMLLPLSMTYAANDEALIPPNAKPGECYARVLSPAKYETVEEKVLVKEASENIEIIPAEYETVDTEVQVIPETKKLVLTPTKYKETIETVEIKPAARVWKTGLKEKSLPVNPIRLAAIETQGVDIKNATANTCYKEFYKSASYDTVEEKFLVQNERNETEIVPGTLVSKEKAVEVVPPTKKIVQIPAEFEDVEEKVLVEEAKTVWKKGKNPAQALSDATGDIMCLIKVPAKYKTITKRIIKSPARTEVEEIPAEVQNVEVKEVATEPTVKKEVVPAVYTTVEKKVVKEEASFLWINMQENAPDAPWKATGNKICLVETPSVTKDMKKMVVDTPESIEEEIVPAVNKIVKVKKIISEAKIVKTPVEAVYKTITKQKKIADTHLGWQRILCQTNMTKNVIKKIQAALNEQGYGSDAPDGVLGRGTRSSLEKYQKDNGLSTGGITYETLDALKIEL